MRGTGILINDDFELLFSKRRNADGKLTGFDVGKTIHQNSAVIIICQPAQIKELPLLGVGIENILLDGDLPNWRRKIRLALEMDRQNVSSINFNESNIQIDGSYSN